MNRKSHNTLIDRPLHVFGDSIACGIGASDISKSWVGLCTPEPLLCAKQGATAADLATLLLAITPDVTQQCALMIGSNDLAGAILPDDPMKQRLVIFDSLKEMLFRAFLLQSLVYLLIARKTSASRIAYSGMWTDVNVGAPDSTILSIGKTTVITGASARASVSGTAIYVGYIIQSTGTGTADVFVDGCKVGSLSSSGDTTSKNSANWAPAAARFGGLHPGAHTVEVIITSSGSHNFFICYIAGSDHSAAPTLLLSNIIRMASSSYSRLAASDNIVDQYNDIINSVIEDLTADGFDITLVDNHSAIDPVTDISPDGIHPNDNGHRKLYANFMAARLKRFSSVTS